MTLFKLPDLGEGLEEAEILAWHVAAGDRVVVDQPLVSVETAKAVVEIPSPQAGRIKKIFGKVGEVVKTGTPLVEFETEGAAADRGAVVGRLEEPETRVKPGPAAKPGAGRGGIRAAPAVRALARELAIDLAAVLGTGPGGAITRADLEAVRAPEAGYEPLKGPRRAMARNMVRSGAEVVPATVMEEADVESWWGEGAEVTLRLLRAIVAAVAVEPALNAWYDGRREALRRHAAIDIGIAVDRPEGLFVPVLRNVETRTLDELRRDFASLLETVRSRRIAPQDLRDPTITLSNFGTLAGRFAALAILPPQVAILGAGRIARRPVVRGAEIEARWCLPLSLTFDHRAVTGGEAARFLRAVVADLEKGE